MPISGAHPPQDYEESALQEETADSPGRAGASLSRIAQLLARCRVIDIFLCVLAYHLLVAIETTLLRQDIHTSWATVRELLATHEIATIVLPTNQNGVLRIRRSATPEPDHRVLYEALGVSPEIIRPVKTWERSRPNSD